MRCVRTASFTPIKTAIPSPGYVQAASVPGGSKLLFVSGQIPADADGNVPDDFEAQCRQAWANVFATLEAAGMDRTNIVKATTFLADREYRGVNSRVRRELLGDHEPAVTVIACDIYEEEWLVEIEVVAAATE
ncbi:enamine deaminase RidA [Lentzea guizhouensis]|uniref:Enamine deaminase RidA n=1 Tax=Lentzea guizhouensis TaxID=1586287 RepID=A0A1B2HLT8_9PSEU|nr:enamine deaminase RidA [Lentzea guizhouensis]